MSGQVSLDRFHVYKDCMRYEFVVAGAGIVGVSAAIRLTSLGHHVALIGGVESATAASAGIITLQLETLEDVKLVKKSIEILGELLGESEAETGRGFITIEDEEDSEETAEVLRRAGVRFKQVDGREARELWPMLRFGEDEVVTYTDEDISVEARLLLKLLHGKAEELGAKNMLGKRMRGFTPGEKIEVRLEDGGSLEAETLILCLGPWTRDFMAKHGVIIPTWVIRCPAFRFKAKGAEKVPAFADEVNDSYWRPGEGGTVVGGGYHAESAENPEGFFNPPPESFKREAERLLRTRARFEVELREEWAGPCSITPDLNPILDALPGHGNIYVVDGLRGYGLMRGPALGYLVADLSSGRQIDIDISTYSFSRFTQASR